MKKNFKLIGLSLVSCLAIFLDYSFFAFKSFEDLTYAQFYHMNVLLMAFILIVLYQVYKRKEDVKISKSKWILSCLFALFMVIGEAIVTKGTFTLIYKNIINVALTIVKLFGYTFLFKMGFCYLDEFLKKKPTKERVIKNKKIKWYIEQFEKHPFRTSFLTIVLFWSIYMIAFYPIVLSPDPSFQIRQYYNVPTKYIDWVIQRDPNVFMTAHHPVLQTFLIGWSIDLGRFLINDNFGLFIYSFFQSMIYISVFAYTISFALKRGVKRSLALILLALYLFVPMFAFYSISAVKDTLYTSFMILFVLMVYDIVLKERESMPLKRVIFFAIVMLLICLFRHNGLYVIALTMPFIFIYSKPNRLKIGCAFLFAFLSINMVDKVIVPSLGISDGSIREMLSVPFQQTARYVKKHEDELSDEEKHAIDKILVYDTLKKRYDPELADDVKNEYNKNATKEDLIEYFKVWGRGLLKHPDTYIDATLNNTYGYFYPNTHNWYVYTTYDTRVTKNHLVNYHFNKLEGLRGILSVYGNIFPYIPGIGLLASIGFNMWILLIVSAYLITNKKKKYLIPLVPLYGSLLICFISPANTYFRYTMPYVFVLPVLIVLLWNHIRGVENEEK